MSCFVQDHAKMLANRLTPLLSSVILLEQSASIAGRHIQDNSVIAYKVLHSIRGKNQGKTRMVALKMDISKAYERLERTFLQEVLIKMGFCALWVRLILQYASTISYKVLQQRKLLVPIKPT